MLNENDELYKARIKEEAKKLLQELNITKINDDNIGILQNELVARVSGLVSAKEEGKIIDEELLRVYDLLMDMVWGNEEDLDCVNEIFYVE